MSMDFIQITKENLEREHVCCSMSGGGAALKKKWLEQRLEEGLVFLKSQQRGKCFIEYLPAEKAWCPISAPDMFFIDCFWVSGALAGHGYARELMQMCIEDAKARRKDGIAAISTPKKKPYLIDSSFLEKFGFTLADTAFEPYGLWFLPLSEKAQKPSFLPAAKRGTLEDSEGFSLFYTPQCPFAAQYAPLLAAHAKERKIAFRLTELASAEEARRLPVPLTTFALFYRGKFVTHEILSIPRFDKLIEQLQA